MESLKLVLGIIKETGVFISQCAYKRYLQRFKRTTVPPAMLYLLLRHGGFVSVSDLLAYLSLHRFEAPPPGIPQPCTLVPTPQRCCGSFCSHSCLIFILWVDECKIYLPSFEPTTLYPSMHHWWLCHILLPAVRCGSWSWPHSRMTLTFDLSKIKVALPSGFDHKATYYLT